MAFRKRTEKTEQPVDPIDRLFDAAVELSEAWAAVPSRNISPWIDWRNRRIVIQTREFNSENHTRESLREELERLGHI